jgi:ribonuclease P protein component
MRKKNVLRSQKDFDSVYRKGKSVPSRHIVVLYRKNRLPYNRIAFLASKKVGNSVHRNRARRLMREAYRLSGMQIPDGYDVIFVARQSITEAGCQAVRSSMVSALRRTGVMNHDERHQTRSRRH